MEEEEAGRLGLGGLMVTVVSRRCSWCLQEEPCCPCGMGGVGWCRTGFQPKLGAHGSAGGSPVLAVQPKAPGPRGRAVPQPWCPASTQEEAIAHRLSFPTTSFAHACFISSSVWVFSLYFNLYISCLVLVSF